MGQYLPITDYDIQALIDNELKWEEEKRIRSFINSNPTALKRYTELKEQKTLLLKWANNKLFH